MNKKKLIKKMIIDWFNSQDGPEVEPLIDFTTRLIAMTDKELKQTLRKYRNDRVKLAKASKLGLEAQKIKVEQDLDKEVADLESMDI